jgi:hypothetical protein
LDLPRSSSAISLGAHIRPASPHGSIERIRALLNIAQTCFASADEILFQISIPERNMGRTESLHSTV